MCSDKPDQNKLRNEFNNNHHSIIVSFDIKYIMLPANIVRRIICRFNVGKVLPLCFLNYVDPIL